MTRRKWTEEEIEYLEARSDSQSLKSIASHLNRTYGSITNKMSELGINAMNGAERITMSDFCEAVGVDFVAVRSWIKSYGLKFRKIGKYRKIKPEDWWSWAVVNQNRINWDRVDPKAFGIEPEWVNKLRQKPKRHTAHPIVWTKQDDAMLEFLVKQHKYSYDQISKKLDRSHSAIKRRLYDLKIYERPIPKKQKRYSKQDIRTVISMRQSGRSFQSIAEAINGNPMYITDRYPVWEERHKDNYS